MLLYLELLPASLKEGGSVTALLGIIIGFILINRVERTFQKVVVTTGGDLRRTILIKSGILFALGVAVHNLPVGLAVGAGLFNEPRVGLDLATVMLLHNFPEGLAISLPMVFANVNRIFIPVTTSIVAIPSGVGSFIGYSMGNLNPNILSVLFGIAIGAIFYVTLYEIAARSIKRLSLASFSLCLGAGMLIGKLFSILA